MTGPREGAGFLIEVRMAKRKLVCIEWVDAEAAAGWVDDEAADRTEVLVLRTYGLLVRKDKHFVVHSLTRDKINKRWSELGKIPLGMVRKVTVVAVVEE